MQIETESKRHLLNGKRIFLLTFMISNEIASFSSSNQYTQRNQCLPKWRRHTLIALYIVC